MSEDGTEVGVVGAVEASPIAKNNVEWSLPALRGQVELGNCKWIGDRDVSAAVHYSWFIDLRAHAGGDGGRELCWRSFLFVCVEQGGYEGTLSLCHEGPLIDCSALLASSSSEPCASSLPSWIPFFMKANVLGLSGVHPSHFMIGIVRLTGRGDPS